MKTCFKSNNCLCLTSYKTHGSNIHGYYNIIISYIIIKQHDKTGPKSMNFIGRLEEIFVFQNTVLEFGNLLGDRCWQQLGHNYAS